ncbi:hypothetical protein ATSB10_28250 [Dyella thiooxydans]|uniref:diguanylate cyclase n=1 Tax=Dyella thiooxydans TaxID=445710 RepID=A0A161J2E0_9GAMM|nr:GGDEF domain-containing protein [Dyella thiooxydans]AND70279.1 hypothetical protein ATSB10_28250 [Dyella thiooxydans]
MELLLLWRWSTLVQATSDLIIAVFFVSLALSLRRRELGPWLGAWLFNLSALLVTIAYWLAQPVSSRTVAVFAGFGYVFGKTMFVALMVIGADRFRGRPYADSGFAKVAVVVALFAAVTAWAVHSTDQLGVIQETVIALAFGGGALRLLRSAGFGWVAVGFSLRAMLSVAAVACYGIQWVSGAPQPGTILAYFVASHSSFDTGAEWVIALGCLLATYRLIQRELSESNTELRTARDQMQQLLHRDQLTGVFNRRALPIMLAEARKVGATVLFFDLDHFKRINDELGHSSGDASLARFARALQASFRTDDQVIRYAGDEFVVVAQDMDPTAIATRVQSVREQLQHADALTPAISFSAGVAVLPPQGNPDAVLREADQAMYDAKARRQPVDA